MPYAAKSLYQWKTDFGAADTNIPNDEDQIEDDLGNYAREIKAEITKDLSKFQGTSNDNNAIGKDYILYKSSNDEDEEHDILIRDIDNSDLIRPSFKIRGNYSGIFTPGTRFACVATGSYADLSRANTARVVNVSTGESVDGDTNSYTKIVYSPVLKQKANTNITSLNVGPGEEDFYLQYSVTPPSDYYAGQRAVFVQTENTRTGGPPYSTTDAHYPIKTFSAVVKSRDTTDNRVIFYNREQELAQEVDDMTVSAAQSAFPNNATLMPASGSAWDPSAANNYFLISTNITINTTDFLLIGAQPGLRDLSSLEHRMITIEALVSGPKDVDEEVIVTYSGVPFPYASTPAAGKDYRVNVQCINLVQGTGVTLPSDCLHPTVKMNEWGTTSTNWDTISKLHRTVVSFKLYFPSGIPDSTTLKYRITACLPSYNGKTFYKPEGGW